MGISFHFNIFTYLLSLRSENILETIESLNVEIYKYKPISGGSYIPTPPKYARKGAIVNILLIGNFPIKKRDTYSQKRAHVKVFLVIVVSLFF